MEKSPASLSLSKFLIHIERTQFILVLAPPNGYMFRLHLSWFCLSSGNFGQAREAVNLMLVEKGFLEGRNCEKTSLYKENRHPLSGQRKHNMPPEADLGITDSFIQIIYLKTTLLKNCFLLTIQQNIYQINIDHFPDIVCLGCNNPETSVPNTFALQCSVRAHSCPC